MVAARQLLTELADRLEEGQAFDIADSAADLDQHEVERVVPFQHEVLDGVRDVGNHLNRRAEVIAAPLLGDDVLVDSACRMLSAREAVRGEALVVTEIEVGLGAVVGDEDLAVLRRAHRARIDVQIRVELAHPPPGSPGPGRTAARAAEARPLPREETTPPVMKTYRVMGLDP